jgi:hypothetical protein
MKKETLSKLVIINNFVLNFDSISYFQHGFDEAKNEHSIAFKMVCGDNINFDFKNKEEYDDILSNIIENYRENEAIKLDKINTVAENFSATADKTLKLVKKPLKKG